MTVKHLLLGTTILTSLALTALPVKAQAWVIDDSGSHEITAASPVSAGEVFIGQAADGNNLSILGGGQLDIRWGFNIGAYVGSTNNSVLVTGPESGAQAYDLRVGYDGSENSLTVSEGGTVHLKNDAYLGFSETSSGNSAEITGVNSSLSAEANIFVGDQGSENSLRVNAGASVTSTNAFIGVGTGSDGNSATVNGLGSSWTAEGILVLGIYGSGNSLAIEEGGIVQANTVRIGDYSGSDGNTITISGPYDRAEEDRSSLTAGTLIVGSNSRNNAVTINGGGVLRTGAASIGRATSVDQGASGNNVTLDGQGAAWVIDARGADLLIGSTLVNSNPQEAPTPNQVLGGGAPAGADNNSLRILNGASVVHAGGRTTVGSTPYDTGNTLEISGAGSSFTAGSLTVSDGNRLIVGSGATLEANALQLSSTSFLSVYVADEVMASGAKSGPRACRAPGGCLPQNEGPSTIHIAGGAILDGFLEAKVGTEDLQSNRYTILTAGSISGGFTEYYVIADWQTPVALNAVDATAPIRATLGYTDTEVYLSFMSDIGAGAALDDNQSNLAGALNTYYNGGGKLPAGFMGLFQVEGQQLESALSDLTGEVGATGGAAASWQASNSFLNLLLGGFGPRRAQAPGMTQMAAAVQPDGAMIQPTADAPSATGSGWTMWGSAFGGMANLPGDDGRGSHDTDTSAVGVAAGWDYALSEESRVGFALAGGGTNWDIGSNLGSGDSTFLQLGAYGSQQFGASYLSLAGAFAWHAMSTERDADVAGTRETLEADFNASNLAGRIEAGHRFGQWVGVTPYAAFQAQATYLPSYEEDGGDFALEYDGNTATALRSELGLGLDSAIGARASLYVRAAWAHDWTSDPRVNASFQSLPGANFTVEGAEAPENVALVSAGIDVPLSAAASISADFDGEFAEDYQSYAGNVTFTYSW